jgi:hypothetical protein
MTGIKYDSGSRTQSAPVADTRGGFSLVELLVAASLALVIMAAVASLFAEFGKSVTQGQARVELNSRLRNISWRLRQDLVGLTTDARQVTRVEANAGYLQIKPGSGPSIDMLTLTTRNECSPFAGRIESAPPSSTPPQPPPLGYESPVAEVAWFCTPDGGPAYNGQPTFALHRMQRLVAAAPAAGRFASTVFGPSDYLSGNTAEGRLASLGDLTRPSNRAVFQGQSEEGEAAIVLRGVLAFDVKLIELTGPVDGTFDTVETGTTDARLRGIEMRIRFVDPTINEPREVRVAHAF